MPRALAHALLFAGLALAAPAPAQIGGMPTPAVQAESHILSAFTTRTDPRVLADGVALGPALRGRVGDEKDGRRIYDALIAGVAGKSLSSRSLSIAEAVQYTALGVNSADPVVLLEAGDVRLLMQYSVAEKHVAFVEQLAGTPIALPMIQDVPKPEPIVERPLPTELPPAPVAVPAPAPTPKPAPAATPKPAPVATPKPAPVATPKPRVAAPVAAVPAAPKPPPAPRAAEKPRPRGECVVKPVMSEEDLWNCSAPGLASSPQMGTPAPAATSASFAPPAAEQPRVECVVKPVMTEEDLRICAAASRSRPAAPMESAAPVKAAQPSAPAAPAMPRDCVIKPVMSEEDLRACGARR